mmetsp:Transcript_28174/g.79051  ORF Transcript_28174/g.79051 Transcript_28174/m.79051 type:complete len:811 (-) Transcript_28174:102-2534(-)
MPVLCTVSQLASSADVIQSIIISPEMKREILEQRRCIILMLVGSTPTSNPMLGHVLADGYLFHVKKWMDDILSGNVGGIDLLLHLLGNITKLPVTKAVVKDSGMGKAIGSVEKHRLCAGTPHEASIKTRVALIKDSWNKSVKALKGKKLASVVPTAAKVQTKRDVGNISPSSAELQPASKKRRVDKDDSAPKKSPFSSLMSKVSEKPKSIKLGSLLPSNGSKSQAEVPAKKATKKQGKRVKWADHFGGDLTKARILEADGHYDEEDQDDDPASMSWSDRKRRDRLREKELLSRFPKAKLADDDDADFGMSGAKPSIKPTIQWRSPVPLPPIPDFTPAQVQSSEIATQSARIASTKRVQYRSDMHVPGNPTQMSDVEQALDMTSQSSAVLGEIPFFIPQQIPTPPPAAIPPPPPAASSSFQYAPVQTNLRAPPPPSGATPEYVQSLGLPPFLVGQNQQALQTLVSTPGLLRTFVDHNGMYDQPRLMNIVQSLTPGGVTSQPPAAPPTAMYNQHPSSFAPPAGPGAMYGTNPADPYGGSSATMQQQQPNLAGGNGDAQEGNLHLSGYGPGLTQAEIIAVFSKYVRVDEIVMRDTFCFVNTSDLHGAMRARDALHGTILAGQPVRIRLAQRKSRDAQGAGIPPPPGNQPAMNMYGNSFGQMPPRMGGNQQLSLANPSMYNASAPSGGGGIPPPPPRPQSNDADFAHVRDDRGNTATKNLFVAGYGHGTTEAQLRDLVSAHATVIGVIMKGTFSFVNTSDKASAVAARQALTGTMFNGGVLRINFAKETGRLGTSFDLTYGNSGRAPPTSFYGR